MIEDLYHQTLLVCAEGDVLQHAAVLFGRDFESIAQLSDFLKPLATVDDVFTKVTSPERLLFDTEWTEGPKDQFRRHIAEITLKIPRTQGLSAGAILDLAIRGRMMQADDVLLGSSEHGGSPLIDAPTSWQYLLWKYEYDGESSPSHVSKDMLISNAITADGRTQLGLLSDVPPKALIELRQRGALHELRDIMGKGIHEMNEAPAPALREVATTVSQNLDAAFSAHKQEISNLLAGRRKFFGIEISSWLGTGAISIAAAKTGNVSLAVLAAALAATVGAPSLKDIRGKWKEIKMKSETLKHSPAGILFRHLKNK